MFGVRNYITRLATRPPCDFSQQSSAVLWLPASRGFRFPFRNPPSAARVAYGCGGTVRTGGGAAGCGGTVRAGTAVGATVVAGAAAGGALAGAGCRVVTGATAAGATTTLVAAGATETAGAVAVLAGT